MALARCDDSFDLDYNFADNGYLNIDFDLYNDPAFDSEEHIYLLPGLQYQEGEPAFATCVRYDEDGDLDTGFGESGVLTYSLAQDTSYFSFDYIA